MKDILIIGAGGVGSVAAYKCAQAALQTGVFGKIYLASRTFERCKAICADVARRLQYEIRPYQVDADDVPALCRLLRELRPFLVLNVALPYQDLHIMDACLECGAHYVDTANYEPRERAKFEYSWQWAYRDRFQAAGLTALLGSGFDPGVTNVFAAWCNKHMMNEINVLDILDCNAGSHGQAFATNFNPEINIREVSARGRYFEHGAWVETDPLAFSMDYDFPEGLGSRKCYLMYHEELESLSRHLKGLYRARFWMTFSESYLRFLDVLVKVGMTSIDPVDYHGQKIVPLQFLAAILPNPASLGAHSKGRTCIGDLMTGISSGKPRQAFIYNICDHEKCWQETGAQAISYTTGVPAMLGAKMLADGAWLKPGVWNMEQLDPDPFMADLPRFGLPWHVIDSWDDRA